MRTHCALAGHIMWSAIHRQMSLSL